MAVAATLFASGVGISAVSLYAASAVARLDHRADLLEIKLRELDAREQPAEGEPSVESMKQEGRLRVEAIEVENRLRLQVIELENKLKLGSIEKLRKELRQELEGERTALRVALDGIKVTADNEVVAKIVDAVKAIIAIAEKVRAHSWTQARAHAACLTTPHLLYLRAHPQDES